MTSGRKWGEHAWIKRSDSPGVTHRTRPLGWEGRSTWHHSQRPRLAAHFNTADIGVYICLFRVEFLASGFRVSAASPGEAEAFLGDEAVPLLLADSFVGFTSTLESASSDPEVPVFLRRPLAPGGRHF